MTPRPEGIADKAVVCMRLWLLLWSLEGFHYKSMCGHSTRRLTMEVRTFPRNRRHWIVIFSVIVVLCLGYVGVPRLARLWAVYRDMSKAEVATAAMIGQPPTYWSTIDLDGTPHALADYRGKVVVLDFWFAGCGPCLDAIPKMIALAEEFKQEPVVILGINTDTGEEEARRQRVLDAVQLTYPTLRDAHDGVCIHETYKVSAWPTMIVLDQHGVVQHVHCGNMPWLKGALAGEIRELIDKESQ
jgi:thiol-disulfide isomerase/thioredoxin